MFQLVESITHGVIRGHHQSGAQDTTGLHRVLVCSTCDSDSTMFDIEDWGRYKTTGTLLYRNLVDKLVQNEEWTLVHVQDGDSQHSREGHWDTTLSKVSFMHKTGGMIDIIPIRCLATCSVPHVLSLTSPKKYTYHFGYLGNEQLDDLICMIELYCRTEDGYSSSRTRPEGLSGATIARIPPSSACEK